MTTIYYVLFKNKNDQSRLQAISYLADSADSALHQFLNGYKYTAYEPVFVHVSSNANNGTRTVYRVEKINEPKYKLFG